MKTSFGKSLAVILTVVFGLLSLISICHAVPWKLDYKDGEQITLEQVSLKPEPGRHIFGTFWSLQRTHFPPLPCYPMFLSEAGYNVPVYSLDSERGVFLVDDRAVDYDAIYKERLKKKQELTLFRSLELSMGLMSAEEFSLLEGDGGGMAMMLYSGSDLWIEIVKVENDNAYLTLHGTVAGWNYQLLTKTNLAQVVRWLPDQIITGATGTNQTDFNPKYVAGISNEFYRAHTSDAQLYILGNYDGYEGNALVTSNQAGTFTVSILVTRTNNLTFYYQMSGVASNGVDYTNLVGAAVMPAGLSYAVIEFHPVTDNLLEGKESITLTLLETNTYLITPGAASATGEIWDSAVDVYVTPLIYQAVETNGPPGTAAQTGVFTIYRYDVRGLYLPMQVLYSLSGTATIITDYTNLNGLVTFGLGESSKEVFVQPVNDTIVEGDETVILSLVASNTYVINTNNASAMVTVSDSSTTIQVSVFSHAIEPHPASVTPKQLGEFKINRSDLRNELPALTVFYQLTGTAIGGTDYTNMTGSVTIPSGFSDTPVFIDPIYDNRFEPDETVTLTLLPSGDGYVINPANVSATLTISDNVATNMFAPVVINLAMDGIDYHQPSNSLIVSVRGSSNSLFRVFTNTVGTNIVTALTNWTGISGLPPEVKLFTVKNTANGFINGDTYFTSGNAIGRISANGTPVIMNWCTLTNAIETNALPVQGSMTMDTTGVFSNQLIAVTSPPDRPLAKKGIWRINSLGQPTLLTNFVTTHLEGVIVLTNDVAKWGPLAGKIVTGDENENLIYTIAGNGFLTTINPTNFFPGGIRTEDFEIIPPNQDLYVCDATVGRLAKLTRDYLTNHIGDLMIVDAGEFGGGIGSLFIVRWDAPTTNFITSRIPFIYSDGAGGKFEHVTFAPLNLPVVNP